MVTPTPTTVQVKIQLRSDTSANWASVNPVLLAGEMGLETNTNRIKIGNGSTAWNSLGYFPFAVSGGTVTGNLEIGTTGTLTFEGSSADNFETTLGVINPTADRTINLPNVSGTIITTGDTGTVTSTMIADGTIVNADVSASAAIAHSKLANITAGYVLIGNASNVPTATQVTGDVTISNTGVTAISSGVIVDADVSATAEIAVSKLANGTANQVIVTDGTNVSWSDDLTLAGNLTVNGITTTINTQDLLVEDKNIIIGNVATPTDATADGGGITLKGATDKTINWIDATDAWTSSEHINIASGKEYRIDGTKVLDATSLGSSVLITSANITDGTIVNDDISASAAIAGTKISPDFGSQTVTTTGTSTAASFIPSSSTAPTNGLYLPSANSVAISTNGTGKLFVDANGNVGVGGTPIVPLDVIGRTILGTLATRVDEGYDLQVQATTNAEIKIQSGASNTSYLAFGTTSDALTTGFAVANTDGALRVRTGNAERLRIDSAGFISLDGDTNTGLSHPANDQLAITTNDVERLRIDSSGRFLIGTTTTRQNRLGNSAFQSSLQIEAEGTVTASASISRFNEGTGGSILALNKGRGTITSPLVAISGDTTGQIVFSGYDGANWSNSARIASAVDGTPGADNMPGTLQFFTTPSGTNVSEERLRITSTGLVGVGTSAPGTLLHLAGNNTGTTGGSPVATIRLEDTDASTSDDQPIGKIEFYGNDATTPAVGVQSYIISRAVSTSGGGYLEFGTRPNGGASADPRMRIDGSGRLLVGTSTSRSVGVERSLQIEGTTGATGSASFVRNSNDNGGPSLNLGKTRGTTVGSSTVVAVDDTLGTINFQGASGSNLNAAAASISALVDGTPGANDMPGRLVFSTTADGESSPTERLRISSTGAIGLSGANYGTSGQALISQGSNTPPIWESLKVDVQEFTSSATWTKPTNAKLVYVQVIGGGGGGGGGGVRSAPPTGDSAGGGGGSGGMALRQWIPASALATTVSVTVGAGGSGGAARTTSTTVGGNGAAGGDSSFGTVVIARGGGAGSGGGLSSATGGSALALAVNTTASAYMGNAGGGQGNSGASTNGSDGYYSPEGPGGGGAGGGTRGSDGFQRSGGSGGGGFVAFDNSRWSASTGGGGAGGAGGGTNGTAGVDAGDGGGGGGSGNTVSGGNGGAGSFPGGGGGGGGSTNTGATSGAGGAGAAGVVRVWSWY